VKTVFADAGYWVAAVHPREDLHDKALQVSSSLGPHLIVASEMVLSEVAAYFSD
jgi:predicted nucleic acid-binding protein